MHFTNVYLRRVIPLVSQIILAKVNRLKIVLHE